MGVKALPSFDGTLKTKALPAAHNNTAALEGGAPVNVILLNFYSKVGMGVHGTCHQHPACMSGSCAVVGMHFTTHQPAPPIAAAGPVLGIWRLCAAGVHIWRGLGGRCVR